MSYYISQEAATILAIIVGPIIAVITSRYIEDRIGKKRRKWRIFYELMKRRDEPLTKFSWALNLIHVEFHDKKNVIDAWDDLYNFLGEGPPAAGQTGRDLESAKRRKRKKRDRLFAILLQEMSITLGLKVDHRFIAKTVYDPIGKKRKRRMKNIIDKKIISVLNGDSPIAVQKVQKVKKASGSSNKSDTADKDTK